ALFPIGHLQKTEVRALAKSIGLETAEKKDSQGLCFIGKVKLPEFLQQQLKPKTGDVIELDKTDPIFSQKYTKSEEKASLGFDFEQAKGQKIGEHIGAHYYTVGQRKGLNIGGKKEPLFVLSTDTKQNLVYVGEGKQHPGLYRSSLMIKADEVHWLREDLKLKNGEEQTYLVRIRYRQALEKCLIKMKDNNLYLIFENAQRGIAKGQFAAWYRSNELIGSGVIYD
ncbi:MAG: tRNA methyl transferase PRC-barrel domain-containing protein, partial [Flavobacteriales bacterium]